MASLRGPSLLCPRFLPTLSSCLVCCGPTTSQQRGWGAASRSCPLHMDPTVSVFCWVRRLSELAISLPTPGTGPPFTCPHRKLSAPARAPGSALCALALPEGPLPRAPKGAHLLGHPRKPPPLGGYGPGCPQPPAPILIFSSLGWGHYLPASRKCPSRPHRPHLSPDSAHAGKEATLPSEGRERCRLAVPPEERPGSCRPQSSRPASCTA